MTDRQTGRIEWIDLAKGICIILVVMLHAKVDIGFSLSHFRMPLYFVISGLFFKTYGDFKGFTIKKFNKLLVPFISFFGGSLLIIFSISLFWFLFTGSNILPQFFSFDELLGGLFKQGSLVVNLAVWFLLALFWCNLIFANIITLIRNEYIQVVTVIMLSTIGCYLGYNGIFLPLYIASALTALPFFCFGYYLKQTNILYKNRCDKLFATVSVFIIIASTIIANNGNGPMFFDLFRNKIHGNIILPQIKTTS